jgi:methyltransferase (TIGR00027 family)
LGLTHRELLIGIISTSVDAGEASGAIQPSEAARGAALVRALASVDERAEIKGGDFLAEIFLAEDRRGSLNDKVIKDWLIKNYLPYGVYAYSIARTAFFDRIVKQSLLDNIPQIVLLGAGYDSRPYRFGEIIKETRIFELDDNITQQRKRELLRKANITIPEHLTYAPISFDKDILKANLVKAGFDNSKQSLFVWEGGTFNLTTEEVEEMLSFIKSNSPAGSTICFDYNSLPPEMSEAGAENELKEFMMRSSTSETAGFGIEEGQIGTFLGKMEFIILEHLTAEELESKFLTLGDGSTVGKVPAQLCIVYASLLG